MAFQAGTQIRPELGNADYSGFARAAEIQGQAFANLGAQIGGAIKDYNEKKEEKKLTGQAAELLAGLPGAEGLGITDKETAQVAIKSLGGPAATMQALSAFQMGQAKLESTRQATEQSASLFPTQKELQEQNLLRNKQIFEQGAEAFPLQQKVTQAQLESMTAGEQRAAAAAGRAQELFPFQLESLQAQIAATEQGTEASKAGLDMAERKQKLSEEIAKNTREQNEQKIKLAEKELNLKIEVAAQRDPVSAKKLNAAQAYLDDNDLIMVDGAVYSKSGWFGGKATEVMNPSVLNIEGMEDLRRISIDMQSVPSAAASENFEGMRMVPEGEANQAASADSAVSAAALDSVAQPRPEGSRVQRSADSILQGLENMRESSLEFGKGTKALPFAIADYLLSSDNPSFDVSKARARSRTAPFFQ